MCCCLPWEYCLNKWFCVLLCTPAQAWLVVVILGWGRLYPWKSLLLWAKFTGSSYVMLRLRSVPKLSELSARPSYPVTWSVPTLDTLSDKSLGLTSSVILLVLVISSFNIHLDFCLSCFLAPWLLYFVLLAECRIGSFNFTNFKDFTFLLSPHSGMILHSDSFFDTVNALTFHFQASFPKRYVFLSIKTP